MKNKLSPTLKGSLLILFSIFFLLTSTFSQSPDKFSYQAVVRNSGGTLVQNSSVGFRISLLQTTSVGTVVYAETHTVSTNANGLASLEIGSGTVQSGSFSAIDWSAGPYFLKTETDPNGGSSYTISGTTQLLSVPYAIHSKKAGELDGTITSLQVSDFQTSVTNNTAVLANTSKNNYPAADASKLAGLEAGAEVNVNADWNAASGDALILNKPVIPTTTSQLTNNSGFLTSYTETDPLFSASQAANITASDITDLSNLSGVNTGDQDLSGLATTAAVTTLLDTKVDKVTGKGLSTEDYTSVEKTKLSNISGVNTGDQDLSALATITALTTGLDTKVDKITGKGLSEEDFTTAEKTKLSGIATGAEINVNADWSAASGDALILNKPVIPTTTSQLTNNSGFLTSYTETDPLFSASQAANITAADITDLSNLSGTNSGDQDLSGLATTASLTTLLDTKVDKVTGKGLSTEDYTSVEKTKLSGIAVGAEVNVQADWNQVTNTADDYIKNKPIILSGTAPGQMQYWNGSAWVTVAPGTEGQTLSYCGGVPTWGPCPPPTPNVLNPTTGKIWMDRNLGASQVATSSSDVNSYGDLYQWGRGTDGHQIRTSGTTTTLSSTDVPGHGNFITINASPNDWRSPQNSNLWQGVNGVNNPCPAGYRIPTQAEFNSEQASWTSQNTAGAFGSTLKLPAAGRRENYNGSLAWIGNGYYWTSTIVGLQSFSMMFFDAFVSISQIDRARGSSVRCIKD